MVKMSQTIAIYNYLSYLYMQINVLKGMKELWKSVVGFEDLYKVSNTGKVIALAKDIKRGKGYCTVIHQPEMELTPTIDKWGYWVVSLWRNGKCVRKKVHRLVAENFLPNPNGMKYINHKDEDKGNNIVTNLEWCTTAYNNTYGTRVERMRRSKYKPIEQYTKDGIFVARYESLMMAESSTGIKATNISRCAKGNVYGFKTAGGYKWRFGNDC